MLESNHWNLRWTVINCTIYSSGFCTLNDWAWGCIKLPGGCLYTYKPSEIVVSIKSLPPLQLHDEVIVSTLTVSDCTNNGASCTVNNGFYLKHHVDIIIPQNVWLLICHLHKQVLNAFLEFRGFCASMQCNPRRGISNLLCIKTGVISWVLTCYKPKHENPHILLHFRF